MAQTGKFAAVLRLRLLVHGTVPLTGMTEATVADWRGRLFGCCGKGALNL